MRCYMWRGIGQCFRILSGTIVHNSIAEKGGRLSENLDQLAVNSNQSIYSLDALAAHHLLPYSLNAMVLICAAKAMVSKA